MIFKKIKRMFKKSEEKSDEISPLKFMLKLINANNPGKLYEHFIDSEEGVVATRERLRVRQTALINTIDKKSMDIFGTSMQHVIDGSKLFPALTIKYTYNGREEVSSLTFGELLYLYMASKQTQGLLKLVKMGIIEGKRDEIKNALGPKYIEFADWVQEEFLPNLHKEYNETYQKIYGKTMFMCDNFFPLICENQEISNKVSDSYKNEIEVLPETIIGQLVDMYKYNNINNNLLVGINAFELLLIHLDEMEEWNAYAQIRREFVFLLKNEKLKSHLEENHKGAYERLKLAVKIATLTHRANRIY